MGFLSPGKGTRVFEMDGLRIGVMICADALYPEISRSLASKGAWIISNPSNIPEDRLGMWKHVGITRAIENGIFYVFINNTATQYPDGRRITGHSFIAAPDGEVVFEADEDEQVTICELDLTLVTAIRSKWPFLRDFLERKSQLDLE